MEKKPLYEKEYRWARSNPTHPYGIKFLQLVSLYTAHPDHACLGLIEGCAHDIRLLIKSVKEADKETLLLRKMFLQDALDAVIRKFEEKNYTMRIVKIDVVRGPNINNWIETRVTLEDKTNG